MTDQPIRCTSTTRPDHPPHGMLVAEEDTGLIRQYLTGWSGSWWCTVSVTDDRRPTPYRALAAATDGVVQGVLELHRPEPVMIHGTTDVAHWVCKGCDAEGYECESPDWPCRTTELIAAQLGVSLEEDHYTVDVTP